MNKYIHLLGTTVCSLLLAASISAATVAAPTFQELMEPTLFPDAQRGMTVESAQETEGGVRVSTTGADIFIDASSGDIHFRQRIGHERPLAVLHLGCKLEGLEIVHRGPGLVWLSFSRPSVRIRINGDSLFMLHAVEAVTASIESRIDAAWNASFKSNHLFADEWGAFGLYTSMPSVEDGYDPYGSPVAVYPLEPDAVLWVAVCPPKSYDWQRSFEDNVVWHWSNVLGYPTDETLVSWKPHGNIVLLQSEVMLWKDWNLDFVPRLGNAEFERVRNTVHDAGMRFMVYTSPYYFLKGTALEPAAFNSFQGFTNWPPGTPTGENMGLFLDAIRRVMTVHRPDGLYFDGQYIENPAALYALARSARTVVGETGLLEWHSTSALGYEGCYLPQADAYVDFILRGEGEDRLYEDSDYLRFFVSGYNIHNSIGVLCNNGAGLPTPDLINRVLTVNARFHTLAGWLQHPETTALLRDFYRPRLSAAYPDEVESFLTTRQQNVPARAAAGREENRILKLPPVWDDPVFTEYFEALPTAESLVSPLNDAPFSVHDNLLQISAHAHTYAFYRFPLSAPLEGFVVKLRQETDGGMSWGPGALLRWTDGLVLRVGLRSDGLIQADISGRQLLSPGHNHDKWIWLRARWAARRGVVEYSADGDHYERLWSFDHGGRFSKPPEALLVGKVPYNGQPADHIEPGPVGNSSIAFVKLYERQ